jgi:hypothetical protein
VGEQEKRPSNKNSPLEKVLNQDKALLISWQQPKKGLLQQIFI